MPQTSGSEIIPAFDKPKEIDSYIQQLGNLTLLEDSINTSAGRKPFEDKIKAYPTSKFLLTKSIGQKVTVGTNTAVDRAVQDLETFDNWTSESIERRQKMLAQLAKKVWDMPG